MYELLGISLALSGLLTFNAVASLLAALCWRLLQWRAQAWTAATRSQVLFALRVFPGLAAVLCVAVLLIPAYLAHEPRHATEHVSLQLGLLAGFSALGLSLAVWRGVAAWLATRKLIRGWLRNSEPLALPQVSVPAYRLRHSFPVIAVVGTFRPRLFIADHLFSALSADELTAAVAHECGHLAARDNLKRALLRACRDALTIVPCGRLLDREWAAASEAAADEYAARKGGETALDLAAALVKIARLAPAGTRPAMPAGALLIGEDVGGVAHRVKLLARMATAPQGQLSLTVPASLWISFGALVTATLLIATNAQSLTLIHRLIEAAVSTLQ
ncbi:MAG TPA: M48 family metalloprotease [Blastocatellia bacterium]|nr:M48 family metalloprotease [Blastocatellia bacterium]HMV83574.1 M48 family metalloprotease [Blastocatellia bacterium]HMX28270.1 M48 family metalloprotease [Blastocatellia bacterium]HNG28453.1 M48 family metalloprotease [Blastocatellia bacterium]